MLYPLIARLVYAVPMQPSNLAKSVTVE